MKKYILPIVFATVALVSAFYFVPQVIGLSDEPVAKIGDKIIYKSEIENKLKEFQKLSNGEDIPDFSKADHEIKVSIIKSMIISDLVEKEADKEKITESSDYKSLLKLAKKELAQKVLMEKIIKERVNENSIKQTYKKIAEEINKLDEFKIEQLLFNSLEDANKGYDLLVKENYNFDKALDAIKSNKIEVKKDIVDYFGKSEAVDELEKEVLKMKKGQVSKPFKSDFGYHIVKVLDVRKKKAPSFDSIKSRLREREEQKIIDLYLKELLDKYQVKVLIKDEQKSKNNPAS